MMKRKLSVLLIIILVIGLLGGCKDKGKDTPEELIPTEAEGRDNTSAPTATAAPEPTKEPEPTAEPEPTETPEPTLEPDPVPEWYKGLTGTAGAAPDRITFTEDPARSREWNNCVSEYTEFLNGEENASGAYLLECKDLEGFRKFSIYELAEGYRRKIQEEMYLSEAIVNLVGADYSILDVGRGDSPALAVRLIYQEERGVDDTYTELLIFTYNYEVSLVGCYTSYYRVQTTVNKAGYCVSSGSSGINIYDEYHYGITAENTSEQAYSLCEVCGIGELKLAKGYVPTATTVELTEEYSDKGYTMASVYCKSEEPDYNNYNGFLRKCYYSFYDFDGNPVLPDADYIAAGEADGIHIVSDEVLQANIRERLNGMGITEEMVNAPVVDDWAPVSKAVWMDRRSYFEQLRTFAGHSDNWLYTEAECDSVYYSIIDLDEDGRLELVRTEESEYPAGRRLYFYGIDSSYTGVIKLEYDEQFTDADGNTGILQPAFPNSEEILTFEDYDNGIYYYSVKSTEWASTFAADYVETQNRIFSKKVGEDKIVYEGYSGGVATVTEYEGENAGAETVRYYRWDDTEISEEEYEEIGKRYFDFYDDVYEIRYVGYASLVKDETFTADKCYNELLDMMKNSYDVYVYSPIEE